MFQSSQPVAPKTQKYSNKTFTLWDRINIYGDLTLKELLQYFEQNHQIEVDVITVGAAIIYAMWLSSNANQKLSKKVSQLTEEVTKERLPAHQRFIILEPTARDLDTGVDIDDLPQVCLWFRDQRTTKK